ncbi:hypothetical protein [Moritella sp. 36]
MRLESGDVGRVKVIND